MVFSDKVVLDLGDGTGEEAVLRSQDVVNGEGAMPTTDSITTSVAIPETWVVRTRALEMRVTIAFCRPIRKLRPNTNTGPRVDTAGDRSAQPSSANSAASVSTLRA